MGFIKYDNFPNPDKPGIYHDVDDKLNGIGFDNLEEFSLGNWEDYKSKNAQYWISLGSIPFGSETRQNDILGLQNPYPYHQNLPSLPEVHEGFGFDYNMGADWFRDTWIKSDTEMFAISKNKIHHYTKLAGSGWDSSNLTEEYAFDLVEEFVQTELTNFHHTSLYSTNLLKLNTVCTAFAFSDDGNKLFLLIETMEHFLNNNIMGDAGYWPRQWILLEIPFNNFNPPAEGAGVITTGWGAGTFYFGPWGLNTQTEGDLFPWMEVNGGGDIDYPSPGAFYSSALPSKPHKIKFGDNGNKLYILCGGTTGWEVTDAAGGAYDGDRKYACNADATIIQIDLHNPFDLNRTDFVGNGPSPDFLDYRKGAAGTPENEGGNLADPNNIGEHGLGQIGYADRMVPFLLEKVAPSVVNQQFDDRIQHDFYAFPDWHNVLNRHFPLMIFEQDNEMFDNPLWYSTSENFQTIKGSVPEDASVDNYHFTYESYTQGDFVNAKFIGRTPVDFNFNDDGLTINVLFASKYSTAESDNGLVDEFGLCSFKLKTPWVVNYNHNFGVNSTDSMYGGWQWWTDKNWVFTKRQEIYQEILDWDRPYLDIAMQEETIGGSGYSTTNSPILKYDYAGNISYGGVFPPVISSDINIQESDLLFDFYDDKLQLFDVHPNSNLIKTYMDQNIIEASKLGGNLNFPFYNRKNTYAVNHSPATYVVNVVNVEEEPFLNYNVTSSLYMKTSYPVEVNLNVDLYIDGTVASYPNTLATEKTYTEHFPGIGEYIHTYLNESDSTLECTSMSAQECVYRYYVQEWGDEEEVSKDIQLEDHYSEFFISGSEGISEYDTKIFVLNQLNSKPIQDISKHTYTTSGIKRIKLIVYRYTADQEFLVEMSLLTKNIIINDGNITIQDFEIFGGTEFNFLPVKENQAIIGGLSEDSKYIISSKKINEYDLYSRDDYLSKNSTDDFLKKYNDGMFGKNPGKIDLGTVRNFRGVKRLGDMTGSFHATGSGEDNSLITNIFIDKTDNYFKRETSLELNSQKRDFITLSNTTGTNKTAVLIGDYELEKKEKEKPIRKKGIMNTPQVETNIDNQAF